MNWKQIMRITAAVFAVATAVVVTVGPGCSGSLISEKITDYTGTTLEQRCAARKSFIETMEARDSLTQAEQAALENYRLYVEMVCAAPIEGRN